MYCPVKELNTSLLDSLVSSCKQTSKTVTVKEQVAVLLEVSVAVQVTVVVPTGKALPEAGVQTVTTSVGQLSTTDGAAKLTLAATSPGACATAITFGGQVIVGVCWSTTVTANLQEPEIPALSVAEQMTVVVPLGKLEPEGGLQTGTILPGQLSVAPGV